MKYRIWQNASLITVLLAGLGCSSSESTSGSGGATGAGAAAPSGSVCSAGHVLCNNSCVVLATNSAHCGFCGNVCPADKTCQNGQCACVPGTTACASGCANLATDAKNCGTCGVVCTPGQVCSLGSCAAVCAEGLTQCGQSCVSLALDSNHCGNCTTVCPVGQTCQGGSCACPAGQQVCNGVCTDILRDAMNCGACGQACVTEQTCANGVCTVTPPVAGSGGAAAGGTPGVGGAPADTAGAASEVTGTAGGTGGDALGGAPAGGTATGGDATMGGAPAGGAEATGGDTSTGGAEATGGDTGTGGAEATGGDTGTGGAEATGGDTSTGGEVGAWVEDSGVNCDVGNLPEKSGLTSNSKLPDAFKMMSGARITQKSEWTCRRAEISAAAQKYELGAKPKPPESVTGSMNDGNLTITVSDAGKSIDFSVGISNNSGGSPVPAVINYSMGMGGLPMPSGVASITYSNMDIVADGQRSGKFFQLYPNHEAGALIAWAWGVSRIIDALEKTPAANIDVRRIGVTGCSRNGKGALIAGAFDERIALTIPQESGSGGAACWRTSDWEATIVGTDANNGGVQTLGEITGENTWFRTSLSGWQANLLPFDHHAIMGMVAPRGLLVIENSSMAWLGKRATYQCSAAAWEVYKALGTPEAMYYSQVGHSDHCGFPSSQNPELTAYVNKYLKGSGSTEGGLKTDAAENTGYDTARWQDGATPTLQ